jgi:hypothetical protein
MHIFVCLKWKDTFNPFRSNFELKRTAPSVLPGQTSNSVRHFSSLRCCIFVYPKLLPLERVYLRFSGKLIGTRLLEFTTAFELLRVKIALPLFYLMSFILRHVQCVSNVLSLICNLEGNNSTTAAEFLHYAYINVCVCVIKVG